MEQLKRTVEELNLLCTDKMMSQFEQYQKHIINWNEKVNLTSITDPKEFELKHYVDSVMICESDEWQKAADIIDVGTGGGFPGVPLAILHPDRHFVLMDSLGKRIKIIDEICKDIGISNVELIHARAEELAKKKEYRESFDLCVSRAVANLAVLSEYCIPFVKVDGYFAPYKTAESGQEIEDSKKAIRLLGGTIKRIATPSLEWFNLDHRILWIRKEKPTAAKYPRKAGTPSKEPLK